MRGTTFDLRFQGVSYFFETQAELALGGWEVFLKLAECRIGDLLRALSMLPLPTITEMPNTPAVLLVLLPRVRSAAAQQAQAVTIVALNALQQELGAAIQVLRVDEETHPAVVRSFDGRGLPAFVLTWHGAELWREQGLPNADGIAALLLSKLTVTPM